MVTFRSFRALYCDPRFIVYSTDDLTAPWQALAAQLAAIVVASEGDPFDAFGYTATASVRVPIVMLLPARFAHYAADLLKAGATACLDMPLDQGRIDVLHAELQRHSDDASAAGIRGIVLEPLTHLVRRGDRVVQLTQREFCLLHALSVARGRPVAAGDLIATVWPARGKRQNKSTLDVHVCQLRKKLNALGVAEALTTLRGHGYAFARSGVAIAVNEPLFAKTLQSVLSAQRSLPESDTPASPSDTSIAALSCDEAERPTNGPCMIPDLRRGPSVPLGSADVAAR